MADKVNYVTSGASLLQIPVPQQTRTYKPISYAELMDITCVAIDKAGLELEKASYTTAKGGAQANGKYIIKGVGDREMGLMIGWQNSYDKSLSLKFAIGAHVFICSNGAIVGDMGTFRKKHQGDIQEFTPATITDYIKQAGETYEYLKQDRDRLKEVVNIDRKAKAELVGRMMIDEQIITATQLSIINQEIQSPTHIYDGDCDSLWTLYNYSTFAAKSEHPSKYFETHKNIHKFFKEQLS